LRHSPQARIDLNSLDLDAPVGELAAAGADSRSTLLLL